MSRTIRRKGWNYFESAKYVASHQNPYQWVGKTMTYVGAEDHLGLELWENDIAKFIHRDLKSGWQTHTYKKYIDCHVRRYQKRELNQVRKGYEYNFNERAQIRFDRGMGWNSE